ncbi:hypothetical protein VNO80_09444 [Phaseolus coccineus]|uniref:Uncharacterized protein n=1 Tax=Phaseolus coccineus TaxID=3886 RepID=A0AAN9NBH7_PHACN
MFIANMHCHYVVKECIPLKFKIFPMNQIPHYSSSLDAIATFLIKRLLWRKFLGIKRRKPSNSTFGQSHSPAFIDKHNSHMNKPQLEEVRLRNSSNSLVAAN